MRLWIALAFLVPAIGFPLIAVLAVRSDDSSPGSATGSSTVSYSQVQALFTSAGCQGCHPIVNPTIDLSPGNSYASLVNQPALEDPNYAYLVAGDPEKSFLYLKIAGFGHAAQIGGRMPFGKPPLSHAQVDLLRRWIMQGARGPDGQLPPKSTVPLPGEPALAQLPLATTPNGTGTIRGTVIDAQRKPIKGALVTLLLRGPGQEGGEEHYKVAQTDGAGRYVLTGVPTGTFELKAYAPKTIYTSHFVALPVGGSTTIDFGLATRALTTPSISDPKVQPVPGGGERLSMSVAGPNLDPNYTLVANPGSGRVFEVHAPDAKAGVWSTTIPERLKGPWIFLAVDRLCSASSFLTVRS